MSKILKATLLTGALALFMGRTAYAQDPVAPDTTQAPATPGPSATPDQPMPSNPPADPPIITPPPADQPAPAAGPDAAVDHQTEAVKHTQAAVDAGKSGSGLGVANHAEVALPHAEAIPNTGAVGNLKSAIEKGRAGDTDQATKEAIEALEKLQKSTDKDKKVSPEQQ